MATKSEDASLKWHLSQNLNEEVVPILCTTYLGGAEGDLGQVRWWWMV